MVRVFAIGKANHALDIDKARSHLALSLRYIQEASWSCRSHGHPPNTFHRRRRCRAVCGCAARWLVSISRTRAEMLRCSCVARDWRASYCQSSSKTWVLCIFFSPLEGRVSRESSGTPECQAGVGLAVLKALTIVAQGGGPNKGLQPTPTASARASLRLLARLRPSVRPYRKEQAMGEQSGWQLSSVSVAEACDRSNAAWRSAGDRAEVGRRRHRARVVPVPAATSTRSCPTHSESRHHVGDRRPPRHSRY